MAFAVAVAFAFNGCEKGPFEGPATVKPPALPRILTWIKSSLKDITRFPVKVQRSVGFALSAAQYGGKHPAAKPWKGEGPGVLEVVKDYDGDTYRAIYTVRFCKCRLRAARISEEIAAWNKDPAVRHCFGQGAPGGSTARL